MKGAQIVALAMPVFIVLIALEFAVGLKRGRNTYRLADTLTSIGLGVMNQVTGVFGRLFRIGIYTWLFETVALLRLPTDSVWVWLGALLAYDFCYYWHHRAGHRLAVCWAAHVVHHQSEDFNLGTALRITSSGFLFGWVFYVPLAVAGVPPVVFAIVALIDLLYQFWVHTQQAGGQARLVRPLVRESEQPPRAPCRQRALPRQELRRHPRRLGPSFRQLRRRRRGRTHRLRHACAAAALVPHHRQLRCLSRPGRRQLARVALGRQAEGLGPAAWLEAG